MYEAVYTPTQIRAPEKGAILELCLENPAEVRRVLRKLGKSSLIFAKGGKTTLNRVIVQQKKVDILSHPYPIDDIMAKKASENGIAFEIDIENIVRMHGYTRSRLIHSLKRTVQFAQKYHTPLIITSGARDRYTIKSPRTLVAFGRILGLEYSRAKAAIYRVPKTIIQKGDNEIKT